MNGEAPSAVATRQLSERPAVVFAAFFGVIVLWAAAVPMFGSPDEPSHMVRAAAIVRGQIDPHTGVDGRPVYDVPVIFASQGGCFVFNEFQPADCLVFPPTGESAEVASSASSYPPVFHLLVGWPTRLSSGLPSLYLMRVAHSLLNAGLLTLAFFNIGRLARPGPVAASLAVAVTPMVLFLSGSVNPSGLATSAGIAIWTGAFVLFDRTSRRRIATSTAAVAIPFCILLLSRRDGLLWGAAILLVLLVALPRERLRELSRERSVWGWAAATATVAVMQYVMWTGDNAESFSDGAGSSGGDAGAAFGQGFAYLWQAIGVFGWLDTFLPTFVYQGWLFAVGLLLLSVAIRGRGADIFALALAVLLLIGLTTAVGAIRYPYFQGRYYLPFAVGIPLLAGWFVSERDGSISPRAVRLGLGTLWVLHQVAFAAMLRRFSVGADGSWFFALEPMWSPPPSPIWVLTVLYAGCTAALCWLLLAAGSTSRPTDIALTPVEPAPS